MADFIEELRAERARREHEMVMLKKQVSDITAQRDMLVNTSKDLRRLLKKVQVAGMRFVEEYEALCVAAGVEPECGFKDFWKTKNLLTGLDLS